MRETGPTTKQMDMVDLSTPKVISTMANGKMIWHRALDHTLIVTAQSTKETGWKTSSMDSVKRFGQMEHYMRVIIWKAREMEKGKYSLKITRPLRVNLKTIYSMVTESINGLMGESIRDIGWKIK